MRKGLSQKPRRIKVDVPCHWISPLASNVLISLPPPHIIFYVFYYFLVKIEARTAAFSPVHNLDVYPVHQSFLSPEVEPKASVNIFTPIPAFSYFSKIRVNLSISYMSLTPHLISDYRQPPARPSRRSNTDRTKIMMLSVEGFYIQLICHTM